MTCLGIGERLINYDLFTPVLMVHTFIMQCQQSGQTERIRYSNKADARQLFTTE